MKANIKYSLLQAGYWMINCVAFGYVTFFLEAYNYTAGQIGIVTAIFGLLAAVIQTKIGDIADKSQKWGWRNLLLLLEVCNLVLMVLMGIVTQKLLIGVLFGVFLILASSMMPLVNAACFYYQGRGINLDFGRARGCGSLAYAFISFVLGRLTVHFGTLPVLVTGLLDTIMMIVVVLSMKNMGKEQPRAAVTDTTATVSEKGNFFQKYPAFILMLVGMVFLLTFHNCMSTYMLQIVTNVGGNSGDMGTALAIAALTELPIMFGFDFIIKKAKSSSLLLLCGVGYVIRCFLLYLASSVGTVYGAQLLQCITFAMYASASVYYTNNSMDESDKVKGQALMTGTNTVGTVIGNLVGGWAIELSGIPMMLIIMLVFTVIGTVFVSISRRQKKV